MIDPVNRKQIIKNLHSAIDSEITNNPQGAYFFYVESLELVVGELKRDLSGNHLSLKDRINLIDFAKQSVDRISGLVKNGGTSGPSTTANNEDVTARPSAPVEYQPTIRPDNDEHLMLISRYRRRMDASTSAVERQNLELEMARQLIEKDAITRNRLMQQTTWAMENAYRKFEMQDKIDKGAVKPSDWKKQELYALALQFNQNINWLGVLGHDLALYPNNERIVREILDIILTDTTHPIRISLNNMQEQVNNIIIDHIRKSDSHPQELQECINTVGKSVKEDLDVIVEVLKALFKELENEKNSSKTSEFVYDVYFSKLKQNIVALIRQYMKQNELNLSHIMTQEKTANLDDIEKEAVTKLHYMSTLHNPYSMLDCLVHVIQILASSKFEQEHCTAMGTDDLLPKLCEVLTSSSMPTIAAEAHFIELFMPAERALGEGGYALTMLQSAVAYILSPE